MNNNLTHKRSWCWPKIFFLFLLTQGVIFNLKAQCNPEINGVADGGNIVICASDLPQGFGPTGIGPATTGSFTTDLTDFSDFINSLFAGAGNATGSYSITYTVDADTDGICTIGETVTVNLIIDGVNPVLDCPPTVTVEGCLAEDLTNGSPALAFSTVSVIINEAQFTAEGGTITDDSSIDLITYIDIEAGTCPVVVTRTFSVTDDCGNMSQCAQTINVDDTIAPTFAEVANALDANCDCADAPCLTAAQLMAPTLGTDACDPAPVLGAKMAGAQIACAGGSSTITNTWTATDVCGNVGTYTQVITITDTTVPTWTTAANALDVSVDCADAAALANAQLLIPVAMDNCDADVSDVVKVPGVQTACAAGSSTITNTWTVTDDCGNASAVYTQVITITDGTAPTWTTAANALDASVECSDAATLATAQAAVPVATDDCDADVSDIVKVSGAFVASATCPEAGTYTNTWTVTDDCGNTSAIYTQVITITDTTVPTWTTAANALDATVECSDATALAAAQAAVPVAMDNCDTDVTDIVKVPGAFVASATCPEAGTYTNTWTVTDACGNTSGAYTQVITITDTAVPTWTTAANALDATVECSDATALAAAQAAVPVAMDNCDADVTDVVKVPGAFVASVTCPEAGTYTNTWTVMDNCGNTSAIYTQVITITDTTVPTWTTAANALDVSVDCADATALANAQLLIPVAMDNCDADVSDVVKVPGVQTACAAGSSTITNTWTVTDDCGNASAVYTQVITITDGTAPTWTTAANALDASVECSDAATLATAQAAVPVATDDCDADVSDIVKVSGAFVASATCPEAGTYTNTWTVTDDCGNTSAIYTQVITITDTTVPTWTTAANALDATVECSDATALAAAQAAVPVAMDNCDTDVTDIVKVPGAFVASATCPEAGTYTNTWTVIDACGNTSGAYTQVITITDTAVPTWTTAANALDATVECSDATALAAAQAAVPVAMDNCDADVTDVVKVPGAFVASVTCPEAGTYTNTWTVMDNCGNTSAIYTQVITITDTTVPTWTTAANALDVSVDCADATALANAQLLIPVAMDNCDADVSDVVKVPGVQTACAAGSSTITNTWTVTDDCGNASAVYTQVITITDGTAPTWTTAANALDASVECSDAATLATAQAAVPVATDDCDADVSDIVKVSGAFVASATCPEAGTYTNTWTVTDDCGNTSAIYTQVITITDTTVPTWTTAANALDIEIYCADAIALANAISLAPVASDNCDTDVTDLMKVSGPFLVSGTCPQEGTITNTWTVMDACGNTSDVYTQVITLVDNVSPIWTSLPTALDMTVDCADAAALGTAQALFPVASDACDMDVSNIVKVSGVQTACATGSSTITNTWTVIDDCGNESAVYTQVITITDGTAPTWTTATNALDVSVDCADATALANAQLLFPVASDDCDADVTDVVKVSGVQTACATGSSTITNTWTVIDDCGNESAVYTQVITITDGTSPTWTTAANALDVSVDCADATALANAQLLFPVASDDCDADVTDVVKVSGVQTACATGSSTITNTWTVEDDCGNESAVYTQVITITDGTAPTWTTAANALDVSVDCADATALANAQLLFPVASDDCDADVTDVVKVSGVQTACATGSSTITNTWTVIDDCGNESAVYTQVITITDGTAPTWTTAANALDASVDCADATALANAQLLFPVASDDCDADVTDVVKVSGVQTACATGSSTITNTWTVIDDCGNESAVYTQVITITDGTAPTWTTAANALDASVDCADATALANAQLLFPVASDDCDADVTDVVKVSGVQTACATGSSTITNTWTVIDDCGNESAVYTQVITITDGTAPTWTTAANALDVSVDCADATALANAQLLFPVASDDCDADVTDVVKVSGVQTACATGSSTITNTWTVIDDCGNESAVYTQVITITDGTAPTWTTAANALDVSVDCADATALANAQLLFPVASDDCDADVTDVVKVSGVQTACATGSSTITNTWTVIDDCGNESAVYTQVITITDGTAPTWTTATNALDVSVDCADATALANAQLLFPVASDDCDADVTDVVKVSGVQTACATGSSTITNTWTVIDDCGNESAVYTQVITITDGTSPTWTTAANALDVSVDCADATALANAQLLFPVASDDCDADVTDVVKVSGVQTACATGSSTITNTWTVIDDCGNESAVYTQVITITDGTAPTWTTATNALDVSVDCADATALANAQLLFPVASDDCDADVTDVVKVSGVQTACATGSSTITNTWTVEDDCGNESAVYTQVITIEDNTAPTVVCNNITVTLDTTGSYTLTAAEIANIGVGSTDLCTSTAGLIFTVDDDSFDCDDVNGITTVTLTVTDECGNSATCDATITVIESPICCDVMIADVSHTNENCMGADDGSITIIASSTNLPLEYSIDGGLSWSTDNVFIGLTPATYDVLVREVNDQTCSADGGAIVIEPGTICGLMIDDPCACLDNATPIDLNTGLGGDDGTFSELVTISNADGTLPDGLILVVAEPTTGVLDAFNVPAYGDQSPNTAVATDGSVALTFNNGVYELPFVHLDGVGYTITIEFQNAAGDVLQTFTIDNTCAYPDPIFDPVIAVSYCPGDPAVVLGGIDQNGLGADNVVFTIDGDATATLDPSNLTAGSHVLTMTWDGAADGNGGISPDGTLAAQPGCIQEVETTFDVGPGEILAVSCPPGAALTCFENVPSPFNNAADFIAAGGMIGDNTATDLDDYTIFSTTTNNGGSNCPGDGLVVTRTYFVQEPCGVTTTTCEQVFTYEESAQAPVITSILPSCYKSCGSMANPLDSDITYDTDCAFGATVGITGPTIIGAPNCPGTIYQYAYVVTDDCNRDSEPVTRDFIVENEGPEIVCPAFNLILECGNENNEEYINTHLGMVTATSSCDLGVEITYSPTSFNNITCGTATEVTITATDACGRITSCTTTIAVQDNEAPVFTEVPPSICDVINCSADVDYWYTHWIDYMEAGLEAEDGCDDNVSIQAEIIPVNTNCDQGVATTVVAFVATDNCGNTTSITGTFVIENDAPEFLTVPVDQTIACNSIPDFGEPTTSDDCATAVLTFEDEQIGDNCTGSITRIWTATDDCGSTATASATITFMMTPPPATMIEGVMATESGLTVEDVVISLEGSNSSATFVTSADGAYGFGDLELNSNYQVSPYLNTAPLNGVSSFDLVLISQHVLQTTPLDSPYKMIAADVNNSGSITTFDLLELRKLILHIDDEFSNNTSWRFVEAAYVFPTPSNPFGSIFPEVVSINGLSGVEQHDFVCVKIGDVNGSAIPNVLADGESRTFNGSLIFDIADRKLNAGQTYEIEFRSNDFTEVMGYQFDLDFDTEKLEFIEIQKAGLSNLTVANFGFRYLDEGTITTSWHNHDAISLMDRTPLFKMVVKAKQTALLSEMLNVNSERTLAEGYSLSEETQSINLLDVKFRFDDKAIAPDEFILYQNQPNPFGNQTLIGFNLPEAGPVVMKIYDSSWRLVKELSGDFGKGYNEFELQRNDLPTAGLLYYQVRCNKGYGVMNMMMLE